MLVEDLERERRRRRGLQDVVDVRAAGRVRRHRLVLRQGRAGEAGLAEVDGGGGLEEVGVGGTVDVRRVAQRRDVVEDPEAAAVRGDDEVVAVHLDVAHGRHRQVELQRLPLRAVVVRDVHPLLGGGVKHAAARVVFADGVDEDVGGDAFDDERPRLAAVVRAVDVRLRVVEAVAVDGGIRRLRVEVRSVDDADLRPRREGGRRDVRPVRPFVLRPPDLPVVGAGPEVVVGRARGSDRVDHAEA